MAKGDSSGGGMGKSNWGGMPSALQQNNPRPMGATIGMSNMGPAQNMMQSMGPSGDILSKLFGNMGMGPGAQGKPFTNPGGQFMPPGLSPSFSGPSDGGFNDWINREKRLTGGLKYPTTMGGDGNIFGLM